MSGFLQASTALQMKERKSRTPSSLCDPRRSPCMICSVIWQANDHQTYPSLSKGYIEMSVNVNSLMLRNSSC
ncbi:hypothetical protein TNCV_1113991 [Trichonephila clavipes]|nr:hypothetical protein TNCV_1113991 [Trichonephila clavipes]